MVTRGLWICALLHATVLADAANITLQADVSQQWHGVVSEARWYFNNLDNRPSNLIAFVAVAIVLIVPLHYIPRCCDYEFGSPPDGFCPEQPLRLLPAPSGTSFQGLFMLVDLGTDIKNSSTLGKGGCVFGAVATALVLILTVMLQASSGPGQLGVGARNMPFNTEAPQRWLPHRFLSELHRVIRRGGVNTSEWHGFRYPEATIEAPWTGFLVTASLLWLRNLSVIDACFGVLGLVISARVMARMPMLHMLGGAEAGDRFFREKAARAVLHLKPARGRLTLGALEAFVTCALLAQLAGFAVASLVLHPAAAVALHVPTVIARAWGVVEWWRRFGDFPASFRGALVGILLSPLTFLAPGGLYFHSPLGLMRWNISPRGTYVAQMFWHVAALTLCCMPLPAIFGRSAGMVALQEEFMSPAVGVLFGDIAMDDFGQALLRASLLGIWGVTCVVQIVGSVILMTSCYGYAASGETAEDFELLPLVDEKAEEIALWCEDQEYRSSSRSNPYQRRTFSQEVAGDLIE